MGSNKESAKREFMSIYIDKTGNSFGTKNFEKHPNKFYPLDIDYGDVRNMHICTIQRIMLFEDNFSTVNIFRDIYFSIYDYIEIPFYSHFQENVCISMNSLL